MRRNEYICDICGNKIIPMKRTIFAPGGVPITSSTESIQRIVLKQMDTREHYILTNEQLSKDYDVCDACFDAVVKTLRERKNNK